MSRFRRAGARWRLLVHDMVGRGNGDSHTFTSHSDGARSPERFDVRVLRDTEFDELVVGRFLHVEQMGGGHYWIDVAGVHINVTADRDGSPRSVHLELVDRREGVEYRHGTEELT